MYGCEAKLNCQHYYSSHDPSEMINTCAAQYFWRNCVNCFFGLFEG